MIFAWLAPPQPLQDGRIGGAAELTLPEGDPYDSRPRAAGLEGSSWEAGHGAVW